MRSGQVVVVYRPAKSSLAPSTKTNMHRRQGKDAAAKGDQRLCTKENCLTCCKKFTAFMFSRVGLFFVMIGYVALGGGLFQALEAGNEQKMRQSMSEELNSTLFKLWHVILQVNPYPYADKKGNFTLNATEELEKFEETVKKQVREGFDGRMGPDASNDWNYFGAILYAVTLVSTIGYGHITTKTLYGKIATILYSAFGIPLMMLFVANIGSTMAKMFTFVFGRLTALFCCRWRNKKKKRKSFKPRPSANSSLVILDEKQTLKSTLKLPFEERNIAESPVKAHTSLTVESSLTSLTNSMPSPSADQKQLPADVRLNLLTGVPTEMLRSRSMSPVMTDRSKDALSRINDLIKQTSVPDTDEPLPDENVLFSSIDRQQHLDDISPIQFYINETNKLTNNLENSMHGQAASKAEPEKVNVTNLDDIDVEQVITREPSPLPSAEAIAEADDESTKSSKKKLKRSKSESTHNRKSRGKANANAGDPSATTRASDDAEPTKSRRRFFHRRLKKQSAVEGESSKAASSEQITTGISNRPDLNVPRKSQSFNEGIRFLAPPPNYEESAKREIAVVPTVTWKPDHELYTTKSALDYAGHQDFDDDDELYEEERMSVPLLVTVFVIPLYLTLGAILFNIWEQWGFLNSFYFCFITLTTIGFGDFVPGSSLTVSAAKEKLISAALYILLGLVLIAMCFNLMKEQLSQKVKQVAGKWGISEF